MYVVILSDFNESWRFPTGFRINTPMSYFMKISPVGTELFHVDRRTEGRTDRQTNVTTLIVTFHSSAIASKTVYIEILDYTGCPRRNGQNFGRVFLVLNYTDITQNTYIRSWTVTEIMTIEKCGLLGCPRTVRRPWRHTHPLLVPGNETLLANIAMQSPWRDNEQLRAA